MAGYEMNNGVVELEPLPDVSTVVMDEIRKLLEKQWMYSTDREVGQ